MAILTVRSNQQNCSIKKGDLKNFAIFTGKNLCQSLFFYKVVGLRPLEDCFWTVPNVVNIITRILTLIYQNPQRKVKISEYSKVNHYKNTDREEVLNFTVDINITPQSYSFMSKNCFKLLFCTHLISDTSYLSQQNIFSGQSQSDVSSICQFYSVYCILIA